MLINFIITGKKLNVFIFTAFLTLKNRPQQQKEEIKRRQFD